MSRRSSVRQRIIGAPRHQFSCDTPILSKRAGLPLANLFISSPDESPEISVRMFISEVSRYRVVVL